LVVSLSLMLGACGGSNKDDDDPDPPADDAGPPISIKAKVKFKGAERIRNDFAKTLGLERSQVCRELGNFSCTDLVHTIALGGVEPYFLGVNEAPEVSTATTPIAVDRVALSACGTRVDLDLSLGGSALIFKTLPIDNDQKLTNLDSPAVASAVDTLYKRAVQRRATSAEIDALKGLYADVAATSDRPARDWAVLSCFAVMSTMENLFY
jgi:hypothetical protein